ncbi:putative dienelactone hydrolase [Litorivivens lipolytica]|uniref:Putative dienelactone hydrolase n=1 Tax=Litorivivens lipolytica TaxID=1524264 RepID=A0A7W4W6W1_9GAMM|nr:alpha/beta fold hydrolase [Litorivivens lipolytica]MBB3047952.1 putative dienelactone hydrolase [Litorivivens lipolytica]
MKRRVVILLACLLAACGNEPAEKPPFSPLSVDSEVLARTLPGYSTGSYRSEVVDGLVLEAPELANAELVLRIWYPEAFDGESPVVIFSHGNWSDREKYDRLLSHWSSHGYTVIATTHLDGRSMARGIFNSLRYGQLGLIDARVQDIQFLLDHLSVIEAELEESIGSALTFQKDHVVIAGHSFGAFTAQQFAGAIASDENVISRASDDRVAGVIAISPPGPMFDAIHEKSWENMQGPVLVTTGTWDSNPQFWPDWRAHLMSFETSQPGEQYALVVEGADHYLGNLICRPEREAEPQTDALAMVNSASVAFLNSVLKASDDNLAQLSAGAISDLTDGFADFRKR